MAPLYAPWAGSTTLLLVNLQDIQLLSLIHSRIERFTPDPTTVTWNPNFQKEQPQISEIDLITHPNVDANLFITKLLYEHFQHVEKSTFFSL